MSGEKIVDYSNWPDFESICLEESWIKRIELIGSNLFFYIEAVLLESHQDYYEPKDDEVFAYKDLVISFSDILLIDWCDGNLRASVDNSGEKDYGHIESLYVEESCFHIAGDFGEIKLKLQNGKEGLKLTNI